MNTYKTHTKAGAAAELAEQLKDAPANMRWNDSADLTGETLLRHMVDQLAIVKRDIAELQAQEEALKVILASAGFDEIEGSMHRAAITHDATRKTINWQAVAKCFNPSADLIEAHTTTSEPFDIVRIGAKKTH